MIHIIDDKMTRRKPRRKISLIFRPNGLPTWCFHLRSGSKLYRLADTKMIKTPEQKYCFEEEKGKKQRGKEKQSYDGQISRIHFSRRAFQRAQKKLA